MIKPFVRLGLPYYPTMNIISFILVATAAWIFVKKAPFQRYVKYILLFSPVFIYCYATISRTLLDDAAHRCTVGGPISKASSATDHIWHIACFIV
jgi:hypothetical protein